MKTKPKKAKATAPKPVSRPAWPPVIRIPSDIRHPSITNWKG